MKIRKFYKQEVGKIQGPGKLLNVLGAKTEIEPEDAQGFLDSFFDDPTMENSQSVKAKVWAFILAGEDVTINNTCFSSKIFTVKEDRIANRNLKDYQ
jgi:hypothetical protein